MTVMRIHRAVVAGNRIDTEDDIQRATVDRTDRNCRDRHG